MIAKRIAKFWKLKAHWHVVYLDAMYLFCWRERSIVIYNVMLQKRKMDIEIVEFARGKTQGVFYLSPGTTMSLYDDLGVGASDTKTEGWSKNFKLLQSQLKVKKAALTQAKVGQYRRYSPLLIVTTWSGFPYSCTLPMMHSVCLDPAYEADHCVGSCDWPQEGWLQWWETDLRHSSTCCCRT